MKYVLLLLGVASLVLGANLYPSPSSLAISIESQHPGNDSVVAAGNSATANQARSDDDEFRTLMSSLTDLELEQTKAGRMIADRELAHGLIEYGKRTRTPEALILGVQIFHQNPVTSVNEQEGLEVARKEELVDLLNRAAGMRVDDSSLLKMAEKTLEMVEEGTRGLAGGPREWTIRIDKGKNYKLDPNLVYNAKEAAIVTAYSSDPNAMLGASVRVVGGDKTLKRSLGRGKVKIEWNPGLQTSHWDCRIFNMTGKDNLEVRIETN